MDRACGEMKGGGGMEEGAVSRFAHEPWWKRARILLMALALGVDGSRRDCLEAVRQILSEKGNRKQLCD